MSTNNNQDTLKTQEELYLLYNKKKQTKIDRKVLYNYCNNNIKLFSDSGYFVTDQDKINHRCDELKTMLSKFQQCIDANNKLDEKYEAFVTRQVVVVGTKETGLARCDYDLSITK